MKKTYTQKAFTLIELLIVIAIVGILASVVLVSLNSARMKARDSAVIAAANTLMKAAQVDSMNNGDYSAWGGRNTTEGNALNGFRINNLSGIGRCDTAYTTTSQPASASAACRKIIDSNADGAPSGLFVGLLFESGGLYVPPGAINPKLSIMVWLPGIQKYYCIASDGNTSMISDKDANGSGCTGGQGSCPGCIFSTSSGG